VLSHDSASDALNFYTGAGRNLSSYDSSLCKFKQKGKERARRDGEGDAGQAARIEAILAEFKKAGKEPMS
jgi:hypothetical protein